MVRVSQAWFEFEIGTTERVRHASRGSIVALIMVWFVLATPTMVRVSMVRLCSHHGMVRVGHS